MLTHYRIKGVPQSIILKDYKFSYKEYLDQMIFLNIGVLIDHATVLLRYQKK